jgi:hypothetical protein
MRRSSKVLPTILLPLLAAGCAHLRAPDPVDPDELHRAAREEAARLNRLHLEIHEANVRLHQEIVQPSISPPPPPPPAAGH